MLQKSSISTHARRFFAATIAMFSLAVTAVQAVPPAPVLGRTAASPLFGGDFSSDLEARCDFDKDDKLDLATTDRSGCALKIRRGLGNGTYAATTTDFSFNTDEPRSLGVGLLVNGDDRPDVAVAVGGEIRIISNLAAGAGISLTQATILSKAGVNFTEVKVADLDGNGFSDVIATGEARDENDYIVERMVIFLNSATGFDTGTMALGRENNMRRFAFGDLNGDGMLDIVNVNRLDAVISVYLATSPGHFAAEPVQTQLGFNDVVGAVAVGQISGGPEPEVVVWLQQPTPTDKYVIAVAVYKHTGNGALQLQCQTGQSQEFNIPVYTGDVWIADINFDGQNDIVYTEPVGNRIGVLAIQLKADMTVDNNSPIYFTPASNMPLRLSLANVNNDSVIIGGISKPKLDVLSTVSPVGDGRIVDVFLSGVSGTTNPPTSATLPKPVLTILKPTVGPWRFTVTTPTALPPTATVKLQYTATPSDASSWVDVPNGTIYPYPSPYTYKSFRTELQSLPLGKITFRAVVDGGSNSTLQPNYSAASIAYTIARKLDSTIAQIATVTPIPVNGPILYVKPYTLGAAKGLNLISDSTNLDKITKKVDGNQGDFVYFGYAVLNKGDVADVAKVQGPASANGFLLSYFEPVVTSTSICLVDVTSSVVNGNYSKTIHRGGALPLLVRVRVSATLAAKTLGSWEINMRSAIDADVKDMSRAQVEVTKPADVAFVTDTDDNLDNINPKPGTMRAAIVQVLKNYKKKTTIRFELPASLTTIASVPIPNALPPIVLAANTVIDGDSQAQYRNALYGTVVPGPAVELRGAASVDVGLQIQTSGVLVRGIQFANFMTGIQIAGKNPQTGLKVSAMGNVIVNCVFEGNFNQGIELKDGAVANQIGDDSGRGNLFCSVRGGVGQILGNYGIYIHTDGTDRNRIQGNTIGSSGPSTGMSGDRSNGFLKAGVLISDKAAGNLIGGYHTDEANFIEGNRGGGAADQKGYGVLITGAGTTANFVQGNRFGTMPDNTIRSNKGANVVIEEGASDNIIGGTTAGMGNKIMASEAFGVLLTGSLTPGAASTNKNRIEGNDIGGAGELANALTGVAIIGNATNTVVGGEKPNSSNLILGNGKDEELNMGGGIAVSTGGSGTIIQGNLIGIDENNTAYGNNQGIYLYSTSKITVGSAKAIGQNVISGNPGAGILGFSVSDSTIIGNRIGVSRDGLVAVGNGSSGIVLTTGSNRNEVGGLLAGQGNIIKNNGSKGVVVSGTSLQNSIRGNNHGINTQYIPIDLQGGTEDTAGATANDPQDPDSGPNGLQNAPVMTKIELVGTTKTKITGTFSSVPTTGTGTSRVRPAYAFDVYADGVFAGTVTFDTDREGDPVVHGAGEPPNGDGTFSITVAKNLKGKYVTLIATRIEGADGSSSEMSNYGIIP